MKKLVDWLDKNHIAIMFTLVVAAFTSIYMFWQLPKDVFPNGEFPRFQIIADIGFSSLNDTELNITRPLEEALRTVPDVEEVRSVTERGTSTIDLYLNWGCDLDQAFQYVQSKISQVRSTLPADTDIEILRMNSSAFPMSEYGIWSDSMNLKELFTTVKYNILPKLIGIDGVYGLSVIGAEEPEIWVQLHPEALAKFNLNPNEIETALKNANLVAFIGTAFQGANMYFATGGEKFTDIESVGNTVIASRMGEPVLLKEIATIVDFHAETRRIVSINGHKGLFIDVQKQEKSDGLKVSSKFDKAIHSIEKEYKEKIHVSKWDLSDFVRSSIKGILIDIAIGIFIILLIVYYVMNRFRYSLPVILVLPVVILFEFLLLRILGMTVNIMTLGGIAAAIGIIADNAIVITENYIRFREEGQSKQPLSDSLTYIVPVTVWATLVSIVVFIPLNILSGVSGLFFKPLAITLATTIFISLIMAVFIIPVFIKYFIEHHQGEPTYVKERVLFKFLSNFYSKFLNFTLNFKGLVALFAVLLFVCGGLLFFKLPTGFLPEWDEGNIVLDFLAPAGNSIFEVDKKIQKVETIIQSNKNVRMYISKIGTHLGTPFAPANRGEIVISLKKNKKHSTFEIMNRLRAQIEEALPELETDFFQILPDRIGDLTGVAKPIIVNVIGYDINHLQAAAQQIKGKLEKINGLEDVLIDMAPAQKEIKIIPNQENAALLGVELTDIYRYSQMALYGEVVSNFQKGLQTIPIRQFYKGNFRKNINQINTLPIYATNGGLLPLNKVAHFEFVQEFPEVNHKNGSLVVSINAELSGRSLGDMVKEIKQALTSLDQKDYTTELTGNYQSQQKSFFELLFVLIVSVVLIMGMLLFIFESYKTALAVFLGTLCSTFFVITGLLLTGTEFDVSSFTGMNTVMGIVVLNGVLVIDFVERFRKTEPNLTQSIKKAGAIRFRPVFITNIAAIAGFLPMALNIGHGGEILGPFSIAMISGLVGSMFCSLIVMPAFYCLLHNELSIEK